jgi:hypothetical protein
MIHSRILPLNQNKSGFENERDQFNQKK